MCRKWIALTMRLIHEVKKIGVTAGSPRGTDGTAHAATKSASPQGIQRRQQQQPQPEAAFAKLKR